MNSKSSFSYLPRLADYLDKHQKQIPNEIAIVFQEKRISYQDLHEQVERCSQAMYLLGIRKGDRVSTLCSARPEFWIQFLSTTRLGAIWVGLNPKYQLPEMMHVLNDSQPKLLFTLSEFEGKSLIKDINILSERVNSLDHVICIDDNKNDFIQFNNFLKLSKHCSDLNYKSESELVSEDSPALIVYTSGTTGQPKGAVLSHRSLCCGGTIQNDHVLVSDPSMVISFPINHVSSVVDTCATTFIEGGKIVFQEKFDSGGMLRSIEQERCTILCGVPTMLQMLVMDPSFSSTDLSSVKLIAWGGAALPTEIILKLNTICNRMMPLYGMTETGANVIYGCEESTIEQLSQTIGKPDSRIGCRIVDESGNTSEHNVEGELQIKANFLMIEYWRNENASKEAFTEDGWFKTGDLAIKHKDGLIQLVGRMSEMFKSGGYNVSPREVEIVLESVAGVSMAAVISQADDLYQEVGHAFVLIEGNSELDETYLMKQCRNVLANYKVPKTITILESLPMLPVGKVDKKALAKQVI